MTFVDLVSGDHTGLFWIQAALVVLCVFANLYSVLGIASAADFFRERTENEPGFHPAVSILKPLRGLDDDAYASLSSFFLQDYPEYELIFCIESESDPVVPVVRRILAEFPRVDARVIFYDAPAEGSPKVAALASAAAIARNSLLLISDADIRVSPDHLTRMVQPMAEPRIGVVTCLYRSHGDGWAGSLDALGLSAEFQRDALVARKVEGVSFAMGSGILIRTDVLKTIGGFGAMANYLADDFLLGNLPTRHGYKTEFAHEIVDHVLSTKSFGDLVRHQLRWNRGIRVSRPGGYAGLIFTHAFAMSVLLCAAEKGSRFGLLMLAATFVTSLASAWIVAVEFLQDRDVRRLIWLVPIRDLLSFVLWLAGMFGNTVDWRGRRFRLGQDGLLSPMFPASEILRRADSRQSGRAARR